VYLFPVAKGVLSVQNSSKSSEQGLTLVGSVGSAGLGLELVLGLGLEHEHVET